MKPLKIVVALLLAVAMMGADGSCERKGRVHSDRPPSERRVNPARERLATIRAYSSGPYTILVLAREHEADITYDRTGPEHVAGGEYTQTVSYTSGLRIEIHVHVQGNKADEVECKITDGANVERQRKKGSVLCYLLTSR